MTLYVTTRVRESNARVAHDSQYRHGRKPLETSRNSPIAGAARRYRVLDTTGKRNRRCLVCTLLVRIAYPRAMQRAARACCLSTGNAACWMALNANRNPTTTTIMTSLKRSPTTGWYIRGPTGRRGGDGGVRQEERVRRARRQVHTARHRVRQIGIRLHTTQTYPCHRQHRVHTSTRALYTCTRSWHDARSTQAHTRASTPMPFDWRFM